MLRLWGEDNRDGILVHWHDLDLPTWSSASQDFPTQQAISAMNDSVPQIQAMLIPLHSSGMEPMAQSCCGFCQLHFYRHGQWLA
jgi:hypothetical protein